MTTPYYSKRHKQQSDDAQERRERVIQMRADGMTFAEIGAAIGVSTSRAQDLLRQGLKYRKREENGSPVRINRGETT